MSNDQCNPELKTAVMAAIEGDWSTSHKITQNYKDDTANWLHAVLHKIEGDEVNSRYWYARTAGRYYEEFMNADEELRIILVKIS
jgi:hypothetical protein